MNRDHAKNREKSLVVTLLRQHKILFTWLTVSLAVWLIISVAYYW
jgi:hypothetical protein